MAGVLTLDKKLEAAKRFCSEREFEKLKEDIIQTKEGLTEITPIMTQPMLQGVTQNKQEKCVIKRYNKLCRHWAKLMRTLDVWTFRK